MLFRCLIAILLACTVATAQTVVLKAARLFDGRAARITSPGLIVIDKDRITGVGPNASVPAGARVIDLGDATLLPGFMDAHTHLSYSFSADTAGSRIQAFEQTPAEKALKSSVHARITLRAGFTTVRDLGGDEFVNIGLRQGINKGYIEGPRMLTVASAIGTTGGHCDGTNGIQHSLVPPLWNVPAIANGADGMRAAVRWNVKYGADVIKVCASGGVLSLNDDVDSPQLTQDELNALVDQAHTMRRKTAAHSHGAEGAKRAVRAGIDSIEHGSFLDDEALKLMLQKGTFYVPTLMAVEGLKEMIPTGRLDPRQVRKARLAMDAIDATVRKAVGMGIRIAFGTDAAVYPHGRNAEEFHLLVERGMTPIQALQSATSVDAELFGIADRTGTLQAGKLADIVAVPGDPSTNIRLTERVFFVMKEGKIYRHDQAK